MTEQSDESDGIYVGEKDLGRYVKAIEYRLQDNDEVDVVARGTFIRKAVDAWEIARREHDIDVSNIETDTETGVNDDTGEEFSVSKIRATVSGDVDLKDEEDEE